MAIRAARSESDITRNLTRNEAPVLTIIADMQPVKRGAIWRTSGRSKMRAC